MTPRPLLFEDIELGHVDSFGSYQVTREEMVEFASRFDPLPFHVDEAAAAANPIFKGIAASAVHTLAMTGRMQADRAQETGFWPHAGLGMDGMRALRPVYPGDKLSVHVEITGLRPSRSRPDCGVVSTCVTTRNQDGEDVMRFVGVCLFKRRSPATPDALDS